MLSANRFVSFCLPRQNSFQRITPLASVAVAQKQQQHRTGSSSSGSRLTDYKRGKGGRSSFSGKVATVFGCSGFIGTHIVNRLGKIGCQVICPYRGDPYDVKELKLMGDLGQILFLPFHLEDETSLRKAMQYSNVVINLVGKDNETSNFSFNDVHVRGAERIARIAKECGVQQLVHFSALNASPNPTSHWIKGGSQYLRSKYYGELAVREQFPEATIIRPSDMFGQLDRFLVLYARSYRRLRTFDGHQFNFALPMWRGGKETVKQPVYVSNVAEAVVNAIMSEAFAGQTIDAVGPHRYRLDHLVKYILMVLRIDEKKLSFPELSHSIRFELKRRLMEAVRPIDPPFCKDRIEREFVTDTLTGNPTLVDLGVQLTPLEHRIHWEIKPYRLFNYYWESIGDFAEPDPPPLAN